MTRHTTFYHSPPGPYGATPHYPYGNAPTESMQRGKTTIHVSIDGREQSAINQLQVLSNMKLSRTRVLNLTITNPTDELAQCLTQSQIDWLHVSHLNIAMDTLSKKGAADLQRTISNMPWRCFAGRHPIEIRPTASHSLQSVQQRFKTQLENKGEYARARRKKMIMIALAASSLVAAIVIGAAIETLLGFMLSIALVGLTIRFVIDAVAQGRTEQRLETAFTRLDKELQKELFQCEPRLYPDVSAPGSVNPDLAASAPPAYAPQYSDLTATQPSNVTGSSYGLGSDIYSNGLGYGIFDGTSPARTLDTVYVESNNRPS